MLTWHAACKQGNGWADRTMYGGEEPGSSPPASHLSAPRAYMPPDSSMSEGTYSTQPGPLSAISTVPSVLLRDSIRNYVLRRVDISSSLVGGCLTL